MSAFNLKIYVNRSLMGKLTYTPLLFPFLGVISKPSMPYQSAAFEKYNFDKNYYELTDNIKEADFVLLPHNYWYFKEKYSGLLTECVKEAKKHNKLILIDAQGDSFEYIDLKNAYILRTSQYRFRLRENEIMIPAYAEDLLEAYFNGKPQIREKNRLPVVGFAGWADLSPILKIKTVLKETPFRILAIFDKKYAVFKKGIFFRQKAINILKNSALVKTNFIIRDFHSGHINTAKEDMSKLRKEFMNNMVSSDYVLCTKGDGNFSIRFYETLSLGRIPLFVDTGTVLPLEDIINYKDFCVFTDYRDLPRLDKILADFHKNLSDKQFVIMQEKARLAFENYLRIDKFTKYLTEKLKKIAEAYYEHLV